MHMSCDVQAFTTRHKGAMPTIRVSHFDGSNKDSERCWVSFTLEAVGSISTCLMTDSPELLEEIGRNALATARALRAIQATAEAIQATRAAELAKM